MGGPLLEPLTLGQKALWRLTLPLRHQSLPVTGLHEGFSPNLLFANVKPKVARLVQLAYIYLSPGSTTFGSSLSVYRRAC